MFFGRWRDVNPFCFSLIDGTDNPGKEQWHISPTDITKKITAKKPSYR